MLREYLKSLADKFRAYLGGEPTDLINAQDFPSAIDDVFEIGKQTGIESVDTTEAFENGKRELWKGVSNNGARTNYESGFLRWNLNYFYPCSDIKPTNAYNMFGLATNANVRVDSVERLEQCGVSLDFSRGTTLSRAFYITDFTRIGVVDCRNTTQLERVFATSLYLHTIEKMIVKAENTFSYVFEGTNNLENITVEGVIGNSISFAGLNKLTHDSLMSIINHLETKTSGTFTLSIGSTNLAKLSDLEKAIATQKGWTIT